MSGGQVRGGQIYHESDIKTKLSFCTNIAIYSWAKVGLNDEMFIQHWQDFDRQSKNYCFKINKLLRRSSVNTQAKFIPAVVNVDFFSKASCRLCYPTSPIYKHYIGRRVFVDRETRQVREPDSM